MRPRLLIPLIILLLILGGIVAFLVIRGRPSPPPFSIDDATANAANPYQPELNCIDQLIQRHDMNANEIQPALARCRDSAAAVNQSAEQ